MLKAECPKCKKIYQGWSLLQGSQQVCPEDGTILKILNDSSSNTDQEMADNSINDSEQ